LTVPSGEGVVDLVPDRGHARDVGAAAPGATLARGAGVRGRGAGRGAGAGEELMMITWCLVISHTCLFVLYKDLKFS